MIKARFIHAFTTVGLLLACSAPEDSGPYVPSVCSDDMLMRPAIAIRNADGTMTLMENGVCGLQCGCTGGGPHCDSEIPNVRAAPGLYENLPTTCVECYGTAGGEEEGEVEGSPENTGMLEIVRVDADGVEGCAVDACLGDFRFEAAWCPE
jgi:hypothetical protein